LILVARFEILGFFVGVTFLGLWDFLDPLMDGGVEKGLILIGIIGIVSINSLPVELPLQGLARVLRVLATDLVFCFGGILWVVIYNQPASSAVSGGRTAFGLYVWLTS
jgi:hypothetical protein